jgi:hypothetical protein
MALPDFAVAIWVKPHRAYGYLIEVNASEVDEGLPGGVFQSFEHVETTAHHPRFQPDYPHRELTITVEQVQHLLELTDSIRYAFTEHAYTPTLGGSFFGVRVVRAFQEATIVWHGRFEDQEQSIIDLFQAVQILGEP